MLDIVGIGELLIDFTPQPSEGLPIFKQNPGGAPCNMLAMATSMGAKTAFIGKVGNDQFGKKLKIILEAKCINTNGLILSDEFNTTLAFVHLAADGERSFSFYRKGCADVNLTIEDIDESLVASAKCVHFGSLSFTDEPSKSAVEAVVKSAKEKGQWISYDPNYRPVLWSSKAEALAGMKIGLKYADFLKVSDEEALLITGKEDIETAAKEFFDQGIMLVCVTLGDSGVYFHHKNGKGYVNGYPAKVIDTTGAGDSFFGAVIAQLISVGPLKVTLDELKEILSIGCAAASIVIEGYGGISSIPSKEVVLSRYNK